MARQVKIAGKAKQLVPLLVIVATCTCLGLHLGLSFGPAALEQVTIVDDARGWAVNGDLYIPRGVAAPYPAVILAHGSGADRTQMDYIASAISQEGIAVLNIDVSNKPLQNDYLLCFKYLSNRSDVDPHRIGAAGFSWGGMLSLFSVFDSPIKNVVSISYTWNSQDMAFPYRPGTALNASYPANILFIAGTQDTMMYPYVNAITQEVAGTPVQEGVVYGDFHAFTAREYLLFDCGHGDSPLNVDVIDATAAWLDRTLNGNTNPGPTFALAKFVTQFAAIAGIAVVSAWLAFVIGKRVKPRPEGSPTARLSEKDRFRPREILAKGIVFITFYVASWIPAFIIYAVNSSSQGNIMAISTQVFNAFPFITGRQTSWIIAIILVTFVPLICLGLVARYLFTRIEHAPGKKSGDADGVGNAVQPHAIQLRDSSRQVLFKLLGGAIVLVVLVGGLVLSLQFTLYRIMPESPSQWLTFVLLLPLTMAFSLGDQVWFGGIIQRRSALQQNQKMLVAFLASFLIKASILASFLVTGAFSYITPLLMLLVLSLPFNFWITQFFKSIYPGILVTGFIMALVIPMISIV
ncbi:MAG TPA: hypothetical protein VKM55_17275 [Candidatus Lokiarchaeia archaeon]|nr:hypothetical protein [Candidatus Lokiarchaeia archaeon]